MGADGGMSNLVNRGFAMPSSDVPPLPQCIPLDPISLGTQKYTRSGELRRALGFPLGGSSVDNPFRASGYKPCPPVATEELKQFKENVLDASMKARERSKMLNESIYKLDKYILSKKRQRSELSSNEKPGGSGLLKMAGQPSRNLLDHSAQRLEDKTKCGSLSKRFRSSAADLRVDNRSGCLSKDQINNEKDTHVNKAVTTTSVHPEERIRRLSAVGEGWDKKMKRKRSIGAVANRSTDGDVKRTMHSKLITDSKLAACDASSSRSNANQGISTGGPSTVIKGKISRAPRTGSIMAVNSSSDVQVSEACEGWEQPTSTNKVISLGLMQSQHGNMNSSQTLGKWVGQRQQKSSRSRRTNVVSPVSNHDEGQISSISTASPAIGLRNSLNGISGCLDTVDAQCDTPKSKVKVESAASSVRLSEGEETKGSVNKTEEKGTVIDVVVNGKGKVRSFLFPMKRNKNVVNDNVADGVRRQGRMRGSSSLRPGIPQCDTKSENVSMVKPIQNVRPGSDKIRSKSGRPPSRKMLDGRTFTRTSESDDDREELLAAAASARKASYLSCSGRFWKKMEPIFGSVSLLDTNYLKQQVSFAQELEDSLSQIPDGAYNVMGVFQKKERSSHSYQVMDKDEELSEGLAGGRRLDKFSSLYQRVLSALIEEDESEGPYNGNEGVSLSFQCASDDSHCGSCNYADAETRDRDRFESEAESIVDFQIQKRCSGDRFSCNKSMASNTTRNTSMSDSLYSSGRWLGDDGLSHSDVEFVSGSCQNDQAGLQPADITTFSDCQYQLMSVDEKLVLELQSIGLFIDTMPDLLDGEEMIDRDITALREGLYDQAGKKKHNLAKIDNAIRDDRDKEKRHIEQVAMEQLLQMAYKRRMACRRNNASKTVMRKVSKQVAMGFIERTLARCRNFELTGQSCFSEPALQNVLFAAPQGVDAGANLTTDNNASHGGSKRRIDTAKADSTSASMLDSCIDDLGRGSIDSPQAVSHSFELASQKVKKRELLLDDVGGTSSRGVTAFGSSLGRGAKGKRSDRDHSRGALMSNSAFENQSMGKARNEEKEKLKPKQNSRQPSLSSIQQQSTGSNTRIKETGLSPSQNAPVIGACEEEEEPIDFSSLPMPDFDSIEQLGVSSGPGGTQDFGSWLDGFEDHDSEGLLIPMDDLKDLGDFHI